MGNTQETGIHDMGSVILLRNNNFHVGQKICL